MADPKIPSHAEIWDDSLLVNSWNDALEEYKQYHSIRARGGNVDEVSEAAENGDSKDGGHGVNIFLETSKLKPSFVEDAVDHRNLSVESEKTSPEASTRTNGPVLLANLIGQVHDENLKNLLMSWYYAGYYTGLYEGQRQGASSS
ncbi:hypothetical protein BJ878DRAFT_458235 [Calycina marina]|uniref:Survival Motor Neuron Gemin2-binding domain-containing protein n=1 Tax=Calycina marina TaxID=1763456 RepID=A0A9P7Z5Z4_9HELO|nr:hypothetical protein BJ878DRAFT_458235 [Calycina marina]